MKNCHTCALARDEGDRIRCKFSPRKILEGFPFYPVFAVNAIRRSSTDITGMTARLVILPEGAKAL